jgi:hypothetical protein
MGKRTVKGQKPMAPTKPMITEAKGRRMAKKVIAEAYA